MNWAGLFAEEGAARDNERMAGGPEPHAVTTRFRAPGIAALLYTLILGAFWLLVRYFALEVRLGHMASTFAAFALVFAPFWFFGFGAAHALRRILGHSAVRVLVPGLLVIPYFVYSLPRGEFRWVFALACFGIPVGSSLLFELQPPGGPGPASAKLCWQDVLVLGAAGLPIEFGWLRGAFAHQGLDSLPKLLLLDSTLYAFLVVRRLDGVGYDFRPRARDLVIGVRELAFFAPIVISLGVALRFITPHGGLPVAASAFSDLLITFFFVAVPEELFFRGLLQNLLEARVGHPRSLWIAAAIFGLSHFNKPGPFNWRYVLLATIGGIFYGRAWRDRRRLLASATTHTLVDVLWTLWFR